MSGEPMPSLDLSELYGMDKASDKNYSFACFVLLGVDQITIRDQVIVTWAKCRQE